jgi:adenosylcobinamide-GDP ribazoletransferase
LAGLCAAVRFLTIFPLPLPRPFTARELGWSVAFFPLVGGLLAGALIGLSRLADLCFPPLVASAVILAGWVVFTGALHLDGFLDTCDSLGGATPEDRLRIMRDERVGAYAVIGGTLLILLKFSALMSLSDREPGLFLAPVLGRFSMVLALLLVPYVRADGLGRDMKDQAGWIQGLLAFLSTCGLAWWAASWVGLAAGAGIVLGTLVGGWFVRRRLGGFTGDVYGCFCEFAETLVLLIVVGGEHA